MFSMPGLFRFRVSRNFFFDLSLELGLDFLFFDLTLGLG